ncbi:uncharacterized protein LOC21387519 [Morus notabilis]|nr:uncharacterized protein LOC21387519 [Morus notabilis]
MGTEDVGPSKLQDPGPEQHANVVDQHRKPLPYLLEDSREARQQYLHAGVPLYRAALRGDWTAAQTIIMEDKKILHAAITIAGETVLHVAAGAKDVHFVKQLLDLMDEAEVELQDCNGNTAFCLAVVSGSVEIVMIWMEKNTELPLIPGGRGNKPLSQQEWMDTFFACIHSDLHGLALKMLDDNSALAIARDVNGETALHVLARKPLAFFKRNTSLCKSYFNRSLTSSYHTNSVESDALKLTRGIWKEILVSLPDLEVKQLIDKPSRFLFEAAELGNFQFLAELIHSYPDLVWEVDEKNQTIFHVGVLNRHANIFNLIHETGSVKEIILTYEDGENNNISHLAATLPPKHRLNPEVGGMLQLQQELLWFEAVKKIMLPSYAEKKNSNGLTPQDLFTLEHATMLKDGENWMKSTATSCMLVSLLLTTLVITAAFHAINNIKERTPVSSDVLNVSESVALVSSSISTLVFFSILTSNYGKKDFLCLLPLKLVVGLATLFVSMSSMMAAFIGRFSVSLPRDGLKWVPTLTFMGISIPVALVILVQLYQLLWKLWDSTFVSRPLSGKGKNHVLHK